MVKLFFLAFTCLFLCYESSGLHAYEKNLKPAKEIEKSIQPYVLPSDHILRPILKEIFKDPNSVANEAMLRAAGFEMISFGGRSNIAVARHPLLPNYLVKLEFSEGSKLKKGKPSSYWLVKRCQGAKKIKKALAKYHSKYFSVPEKWIYQLPKSPEQIVLVVEDMHLFSEADNLHIWKNNITPAILTEFCEIIMYAGGDSYRPDNVAYTFSGKFAFIDTEYPDRRPNLNYMTPYLSDEMQAFWQALINISK